jgi:hypothetical protein
MHVLLATMLLGVTLAVAGCGGDNFALCDGCGKPTPTVTPTSTATTPSPTVSVTPTPA